MARDGVSQRPTLEYYPITRSGIEATQAQEGKYPIGHSEPYNIPRSHEYTSCKVLLYDVKNVESGFPRL